MCGFLQVTVLCQDILNKVWITPPPFTAYNMLALTKIQRGAKMLAVEPHSCHVYACIEQTEKLQGSEVKNFMVVIYWSVSS